MLKISLGVVVAITFAVASCERQQATSQAAQANNDSSSLNTRASQQPGAPPASEIDSSQSSNQAAQQAADQIVPAQTLSCTPSTFGSGDTLTLRMKTPHGDYLIGTQPGDSLFYIVYPQFNVARRRYSLMPSDSFKTIPTLRLAADVRAVPWYYRRDTTLAPFFARPGKYVLTMGEKLEGGEARAVSCSVTFTGGK